MGLRAKARRARRGHCVVVIAGEHEILFADGVVEASKACIPWLQRVEVVEGVGHGLIWEEPERLNALILAAS